MKKKILAGMILSLALWAQNSAFATYVYMDFDGDAAFPSLTWQEDTTGLAAFTGSAFGLSTAQRDTVVTSIMSLVLDDYLPWDIDFVTDTTGLSSWYTWGVDDSAYVFSEGQPTPPIGPSSPYYDEIDPYVPCPTVGGYFYDCHRLYGKAMGGTLAEPNDQYGNNIYNPTYARTFAGSLALGPGTASPSSPALNIATHTLDQIAQALANQAAHEIAHLFGAVHPSNGFGACTMMWVEVESVEANENKCFSSADELVLLASLGVRPEDPDDPDDPDDPTPVPEPGTLALLGIGLIAMSMSRRRKRV